MTASEEKSLVELLDRDRRFPLEAYLFVREALAYASDILEMGAHVVNDETSGRTPGVERHLTGQELCEAIRVYALNQFGLLAQTVLNRWGVQSTSDFGDIVYNMIDVGLMKKSKGDRRSHFDNVYDFPTAFRDSFRFCKLNLKE